MDNNNEMALSPWQPLNWQRVQRIPRWNSRTPESGRGGVLRVCTVNVGKIRGRSREVVDMLARRLVDVCCVQEVQYKGGGAATIGSGEEKFKFWYSGCIDGGGGVGVLLRHELVGSVVEVERFSHRVMKVKIVIGRLFARSFRYMLKRWGGRMRRRASSEF